MRVHPKSLLRLNVAQVFQFTHGETFTKLLPLNDLDSSCILFGECRRYDYDKDYRVAGMVIQNPKAVMPVDSVELNSYLSYRDTGIQIHITPDALFKKPSAEIPELYLGYVGIRQGEDVQKITIAFLIGSSFV